MGTAATSPRRVLISGAGVAGLAAAMWLERDGIEAVVVEKFPGRRQGGFIVGLCDQAYTDAETLNVMSGMRARDAAINRSRYVNAAGRTLLRLDYRRLFDDTQVIQIMRDDLVDAVYDVARNRTDIRFGDALAAIHQDRDGVDVTFESGREERFDAVIGADGQNSRTRGLIFSEQEIGERYLGLMCAAFRLPNVLGLDRIFETHMERHRYMAAFSTRDGDMGAVFIWQTPDRSVPPFEQRTGVLKQAFSGASDAALRVLDHCPDDGNFYMDPTVQIRLPSWRNGRVALIGDAAHSLTLFSGRGAAAAFADAGYLCRAMAEAPVETVFSAFDQSRRPHLDAIQDATRKAVSWYVPGNAVRHWMRDGAMAALPSRLFEHYFHRKYSTI